MTGHSQGKNILRKDGRSALQDGAPFIEGCYTDVGVTKFLHFMLSAYDNCCR